MVLANTEDGKAGAIRRCDLRQELAHLALRRRRTDSTHGIGAVRTLTRLACAIETLRTALDALAVAAPEWLRVHADKAWAERYERRGGDVYIPKGEVARRAFAETVGRDGETILSAVTGPGPPARLADQRAAARGQVVRAQHCGPDRL